MKPLSACGGWACASPSAMGGRTSAMPRPWSIPAPSIDANAEVAEALRNKLPVIPRAEMLAELMRMKFSLAVAGTHGKTTTTSMIAAILTQARLDPTYVVGGKLKVEGSGAKLGSSRLSGGRSRRIGRQLPETLAHMAVVTNIENDHLEFYGRMKKAAPGVCRVRQQGPFLRRRHPQQRLPPGASHHATDPQENHHLPVSRRAPMSVPIASRCPCFPPVMSCWVMGRRRGRMRLTVGGQHNVANSLAAIAAALEVGIPCRRSAKPERVQPARTAFPGALRRPSVPGGRRLRPPSHRDQGHPQDPARRPGAGG